MSRILAAIAAIATGLSVAACGGDKPIDLSCDKPMHYQSAVATPRVESPEGLDSLNELREIPLPEAAPRPERPKGSPCIDRPPRVRLTDGD